MTIRRHSRDAYNVTEVAELCRGVMSGGAEAQRNRGEWEDYKGKVESVRR